MVEIYEGKNVKPTIVIEDRNIVDIYSPDKESGESKLIFRDEATGAILSVKIKEPYKSLDDLRKIQESNNEIAAIHCEENAIKNRRPDCKASNLSIDEIEKLDFYDVYIGSYKYVAKDMDIFRSNSDEILKKYDCEAIYKEKLYNRMSLELSRYTKNGEREGLVIAVYFNKARSEVVMEAFKIAYTYCNGESENELAQLMGISKGRKYSLIEPLNTGSYCEPSCLGYIARAVFGK